MNPILTWIAVAIVAAYLVAFVWAGRQAARAAGRSIWLFGAASGRDRLAALGFRAAFTLAVIGPAMSIAFPSIAAFDPLRAEGLASALAVPGLLLALGGAVLALSAQATMGASWRVGVHPGALGSMVDTGLFRVSRNPTFLGQFLLLGGIALACPGSATAAAVGLFGWSAHAQIRSEERTLEHALGEPYRAYLRKVPRWIGLRR